MKILHLTIKRKWFLMIASGEKKEEYRELKDYWFERLTEYNYPLKRKHFDIVRFRNGYCKNSPVIDVKFKGVSVDQGKPKWGAEKDKEYFVIKLGDIINASN